MKKYPFKFFRSVRLFVLLICAMGSPALHAEYFGSLNGRSANFSTHPKMTVEATFATGDFAASDYQQLGLRLNYQYSMRILAFGDLGQSELSSKSDYSFGIGAYYSLDQSILWSDDSAIKLSVHQVDFGVTPGRTSCTVGTSYVDPWTGTLVFFPGTCSTSSSRGGEVRNIAAELLISGAIGRPVAGNGASWYANGGIQMLTGDFADDNVVSIGSGIVYQLDATELYAGWEYADEVFVGIGLRYMLK